MVDVLTPSQRSHCMSRIRSVDTGPEKAVRSLVHKMGFRFRLHGRNLPGRPDLVFASRRKVVFVHGCFWHMHKCRWGSVTPKTNTQFWREKREGNVARDGRNLQKLRHAGWRVLTLWECQTRDTDRMKVRLSAFLGRPGRAGGGDNV
jgi:DNA mismatch endonuclease, patch repair protein